MLARVLSSSLRLRYIITLLKLSRNHSSSQDKYLSPAASATVTMIDYTLRRPDRILKILQAHQGLLLEILGKDHAIQS